MEIHKGTIVAFYGGRSSLAQLHVVDKNGGSELVMCENPSTVRALENAFGDVITNGHCVNPSGNHVNQEIYWSTDDIGLLVRFVPVDDATDELIEMYENGSEPVLIHDDGYADGGEPYTDEELEN